ncbi:hypothetical protein JOD54_003519 [Actinokineospora baliensis]|uniref:hypothetical protein n=1 Tax=Actinokineospora baliensis TaxID=547056 RepID=UPI00195D503E|nr:hypothetical protein [Actinokineospora baliensis]MBM7773315.1 hypothetical protein [Actinokineospora baliensis]
MATRLLLEGPDLEALLDRVRTEHGADARIVSADRLRKGGVAGFFSKQWFEIGVEVPEPGDPRLPREQVLSVADLMDMADKADGAAEESAVPEPRAGVVEDEAPGPAGDPFARFFAEAGGPVTNGVETAPGISAAQARAAGPKPRGQSAGEWAAAVRPRTEDQPTSRPTAPRPGSTRPVTPRPAAPRTAEQREADARLRAAVLGEQPADEAPVDELTDEQLREVLLGAQSAPPRPIETPAVRPAEFPAVSRPAAGGRVFEAQPAIEDDVDEQPTPAPFGEMLVPPRMPSSTARHALPEDDADEDYLEEPAAEPISAEPISAVEDDDDTDLDTDPAWPTADEPRLVADRSPRPRRRWDTPVPRDLLVSLPGKVIVVAGALQEATAAAEWICQKMRLGPGAVQVAGPDQIGRGRVLGPEHAAELAYDLKRSPVPSVVAIASAVEDPEGGRWAGAVAKALGAKHIVAAVDATRKTADLRRHLADLGGVDALAVHGAAASADPDSVRELGLPILTIDGVPPSTASHRRT